jgi:hypothetical protein
MARSSFGSRAWNRENAKEIMRGNIERDRVGRQLAPEAREKAVEFAVGVWKGQMGNGTAAQLGIKHVTSGILKD